MRSRFQGLEEFFEELNQKLSPYNIGTAETNILEDTLVKAAGIQSANAGCHVVVNGETEEVLFKIENITPLEADSFKDFLTAVTGVASSYTLESDGVYYFPVTTEQLKNNILPRFMEELKKIDEVTLGEYRAQTENPEEYELHQLDVLFAEIQRLSAELQSSAISDYVKGQLNIIFDRLIVPQITAYHSEHKGHGCDPADAAIKDGLRSYNLYKALLASNDELAANELAVNLQLKTTKYLSSAAKMGTERANEQRLMQGLMQQFGMFGGRQPGPGMNLPNLNLGADASSSDDEDNDLMSALLSSFNRR